MGMVRKLCRVTPSLPLPAPSLRRTLPSVIPAKAGIHTALKFLDLGPRVGARGRFRRDDGRKLRTLFASLALLGTLSACAQLFAGAADQRLDAESQQAYRARMEKEVEVVVAVPGAKVCRQLTVGIGNREWVRGAVVEAGGGTISVRIDEPGQYLHTLNGVEVRRGTVVRDAFGAWTPCL